MYIHACVYICIYIHVYIYIYKYVYIYMTNRIREAVCCSVMQCTAVSCSMLQCVAGIQRIYLYNQSGSRALREVLRVDIGVERGNQGWYGFKWLSTWLAFLIWRGSFFFLALSIRVERHNQSWCRLTWLFKLSLFLIQRGLFFFCCSDLLGSRGLRH